MKGIIISIIVAFVFIGGTFLLVKTDSSVENRKNDVPANNVTIRDGIQVIEIRAKGGYQPRRSIAEAGLPTILRFDSKGTFDCSASVRIPSMNISQSLDFSGYTEISLGSPKAGVLRGGCSMGMYPFEIEFKNKSNPQS